MNDHDDTYRMSGAYALNALDENERVQFEDLLAESEELRTEVTELSDTAVLLGLSSRPIAPPPELKANLMALLATTPQLGAIESTARAVDTAASVPSIDDQRKIERIANGEHRSHRAESKARARWLTRPTGALLATAAAIALVVGGIGGALIGISSSTDPLEQLASAQDLQVTPTDVTGGGTVTLMSSDQLDRSAVAVSDLPTLSADQVYQLWYITDDGATSAGLLSERLQLLEGHPASGATFGMTVEPAGGSKAPTSDPIVTIDQA